MADGRIRRRLAAILAADVVGYSRLVRADEAGTLARLRGLRKDVVEPLIAAHDGLVVKLMGDGMLVEFPSVTDAVGAAEAIQTRMADLAQGMEAGERILFRVGINLGDVVIDGDDIQGDGVNVAARLEALAPPGGMCVSGAVHELIRHTSALGFTDLGPQTVKNIDEPVRAWLWQASAAGDPVRPAAGLALPDRPSIAVLPFDNMSGDPEQEYFADGIAEDLITGLSRMRWFFVSARNSSFTYKGRAVDVKQVSRELGVRYVLEGSVRKAGNRVRITVQLIDATTGNHLWAERYDRDLSDIFAVQDEITETVVATIEPQLYVAESERAGRKGEADLDAWDLTMRAMPHLWRLTAPGNECAQELLRTAIARDPNYAPAHGPLAYSYIWHAWMGWGDAPVDLIPKARRIGLRALELDDQDPWAHLVVACNHGYDKRHADAVEELGRALDLNPSFALAYSWLGIFQGYAGELEASHDALDRAYRISPRDPVNAWLPCLKAIALFDAGRYEEARALSWETVRQRRDMTGAWRLIAITSAHLGAIDEAARALAEAKRVQPTLSLDWARRYGPWIKPGTAERYVEGFRLAGLD